MKPSEIRTELLDQHAALRELSEVVTRAAAGLSEALDALCNRIQELANAMEVHNQTEERLLRGVLPSVDAWGTTRTQLMDDHHADEHQCLLAALRAAAEHEACAEIVTASREAIAQLMEHMSKEDAEFLNRDVLHDDVVAIDQTDG